MSWSAKPSGGYAMTSAQGTGNIYEMHYWMQAANYTLEAQSAVVANCNNESALNPWRWQSDTVNYSAGYGLFQFTPATGYFNDCSWVHDFAPNTSTSAQTSGASPNDGNAQMDVLINDYLNKWTPYCWRSYWTYDSYLDNMRQNIINTWGNGSTITQAQFATITDLESALFCFFACYEGPRYISDYYGRVNDAYTAYQILSGAPYQNHIPIWLLFKLKNNNKRR